MKSQARGRFDQGMAARTCIAHLSGLIFKLGMKIVSGSKLTDPVEEEDEQHAHEDAAEHIEFGVEGIKFVFEGL